MTFRGIVTAVLGATAWSCAASTALAAPAIRGVAIEQSLEAEPIPAPPADVPLVARLAIDRHVFDGSSASTAWDRLQERLKIYQSSHVAVLLALGTFPSADADVEAWRQFLQMVAERCSGAVAAYQIGAVAAGDEHDVNRYVYLLKLAAVQLRAVESTAVVVQGPIPSGSVEWEARVFAAGAGPYIDAVAIDGLPSSAGPMTTVIEKEKPSGLAIIGPVHLPADPAQAAAQFVETRTRALGTFVHVVAYDGEPAAIAAALSAARRIADLIAADLVTLDERAAVVRFTRAERDVTASVAHTLLYSLTGFDTFLVYGPAAGATIELEISVANATNPMVRDLLAGTTQKPLRSQTDGAGKRLRFTLPLADHPLVLDFNFGIGDTYILTSEARKESLPRVEEIIFRYRQAQAAQDAALENYTAHVRIEQHFHPSPADPSYNIVTENRLFADRVGVEWEELSFELNGAKWTANRPAFPLVQPEKVLSLPLDLRLNEDYTYRLDGVEPVSGRPAFVIRFDPVDARRALYRGTVWIDRRSFVRLKVQAVETKLAGPVVSNDETQIYAEAGGLPGRPAWLMNHLVSKQVFLIAGRSVLVERELHFTDVSLNVPDFNAVRTSARASNRIMYRDTDQGVRYLVKKGETRVVSNQMTTSARAFALGADVDPSFDYPLPIGGLDILDFNFLNRDMQLALLYGGVIALGNLQHPNLWGGKFDASIDFFGLAVKSNDDVFDALGRRSGERVNRIPVATGVNIGYQVTPFHKLTGHYELHYDAYFRDATTAADFAIPSDTATNGEGAGYEFRRRGYSATANVAAYQRTKWTSWGTGADFDADARTYTKYDIGLSKDFVFKTFHTIHLNATYFGGRRLDRFSMYQFGLFDATRMHGVPSAVRFAELAMLRGSYSFNLFEQYRFDLFLDQASGRDPRIDDGWHQVTATGVRLNLRAPRNTILQLDFGKSFLPDTYRRAGSTVLQILLLKPL